MQNTEFIPVAKGSDYIEVHPAALAGHQAVGWKVCGRREPAEDASEGAKKASIGELRDALTAKGIPIPEGAKKADLQALLDAAA